MKTFTEYGIEAPETGSGEYRTICPTCEPTRQHPGKKDLSVNLDKRTWLCHHCNWTGGIPQTDRMPNRAHNAPQAKLQPPALRPLTDAAISYLKSRCISTQTAAAAGIRSATVYSHKLARTAEAIAFPVVKSGKVVNVKFRTIEQKDFSQTPGGDQAAVFNGDNTSGSSMVVLTEGEFDTLACIEAGFTSVVSSPNGAPPAGSKSEKKLAFCSFFEEFDKVLLCLDKDAPGLAFEKLIVENIGAAKCYSVEYPAGCKDANEVLMKHGAAALREALEAAKPYPVDGLATFQEFESEIFQYWKDRGEATLFSTGIRSIDPVFKLQVGTLNILTGVPSHGKSEFVDQVIINTISQYHWKWAIFSPENYPPQCHFQKLAEKLVGKPFFDPPGNARWSIAAMTDTDRRGAMEILSKYTRILTLTESGATLDNILSRIEVCARRDKIRAFVIDPWNEIEHTRPPGTTETEHIGASLSRIRNFARLHNLSAWIVAHPMKLQRDKAGAYPVPTPYDINGSAHWRNKADVCLCIWRDLDKNDGNIELHVQKIRHKIAGVAGSIIDLHWTRCTGQIEGEA